MALGGKTVQYTLAVNMETGQLTAESQNVANQLGLIKRNTDEAGLSFRDVGREIKAVRQAMSILSGAAVFGLVVSQMSSLVEYGQQFHGRTRAAADEMERLGKYLKSNIGESGLFASILEGISWTVKAISLGKTAGFGAAGRREKEIAKIQTDAEIAAALRITNIQKETQAIESAINALKKEGINLDQESLDLLYERNNLLSSDILQDTAPIIGTDSKYGDFDLYRARIEMETDREIIDTREGMFDELDKISMDAHLRDIEADKAWAEEKQSLYAAFFSGVASGFASFGAALANGTNGLKNFGSVFLKMISQLAIQFGTFLILYGTGMGLIPGGQSFSAGAIAAGIALTIFGGALGALAGGGRGASRGSEREQRFRDSNFNRSEGGGTVINNYVNFQNAIGLDDRSRKEVAEFLGEELFKQNKLGRLSVA